MERLAKHFNTSLREPVSALTHFAGFLVAIPVFIILLIISAKEASIYHVVSFAIFGVSVLMLYGASTVYHGLRLSAEKVAILRRVDHMMIFVLIAGTYTPVCLISLKGVWGWTLLCLVWGFALGGIILKAVWFNAPRWLSTAIYVIMGWLVVFAFYPLGKAVPVSGILTLLAGGISYTVGAVVYALKKPWFNFKGFGFHEVFHLFVLLGTALHIIFMFAYVL
ncbi:MAG: PAQR family membrane homeostasis protein TrhA [Anaerotignaceae bacterium]